MWMLWIVAFFGALLLIGAWVDRRRRRGTGSSVPGATGRTAQDVLGDPNIAIAMSVQSINGANGAGGLGGL